MELITTLAPCHGQLWTDYYTIWRPLGETIDVAGITPDPTIKLMLRGRSCWV